jgi:signal transduction histidine kinase
MIRTAKSRLDNLPLAVKFAVIMTTLVVVITVSLAALSVRREQQAFRAELKDQARLMLDTLSVSSANALYLLDADELMNTVENLNESPLVTFTHFYDDQGRLIGEPAATGELQVDPLGSQLIASSDTRYDWQSDQLVAGRSVVVGRQTLGAVSIGLSTAALNAKVADARTQALVVVLITSVIGALLAVFISQTVTVPLKTLVEATRQLASGQPLPGESTSGSNGRTPALPRTYSNDETGQLSRSFDEMATAIRKREQDLRDQAENLRLANARAQEASRVKGEFLATMSHELRTPLNAIIGFSDLLLLGAVGALAEAQQQYVSRLRENGQRLLNLVNDILDLTRIEANRIDVVSRPFSPRALSQRLTAQVESLAKDKALFLKTVTEDTLPETVIGDEKRVEQVVTNLLSNALKFTEQGGVTLKVWGNQAEQTWHISVTDTGIGIPPHALDVIFEEFRQVDGSSTRAYSGTGLGLAIARSLTRTMGGQIKVESQLQKGSVFTVTLPLVLGQDTNTTAQKVTGHA